jgi:hypothetical protein
MKNQIKNGTYISTMLFFGFVGLCVFTLFSNPNPNLDWSYISLGKDFHVAITKNWGGNLVFFNEERPYTGSIIKFAGDKTINEWGLNGWGIYFRHIENSVQKSIWWTLMISLWWPIILFGMLPAIYAVKKLRAAKKT